LGGLAGTSQAILIINDIAAAIRTLSSKSLYLPEITWYCGAITPFFRLTKAFKRQFCPPLSA
jgi:hypothetical protein